MTEATTAAERLGIRAHSRRSDSSPSRPVRALQVASTTTTSRAVTGFEAEWKLTPVDRIRDLIDGELDGSPYAILYPEVAGTTRRVDRPHATPAIGTAGIPEERASANAWSQLREGAAHLASTGDADTALTVTRAGLGDAPRAAHIVITAAPNSHRARRARQPRRRAS